MSKLFQLEIPYPVTVFDYINKMKNLPNLIWFDSGKSSGANSRFDLVTASPWLTLQTQDKETLITGKNHHETSRRSPFELIEAYCPKLDCQHPNIPFCGGACGYFGYDLCHLLEEIPSAHLPKIPIPDCFIGIYDWALIVDHKRQLCQFVSHLLQTDTFELISQLHQLLTSEHDSFEDSFILKTKFQAHMSYAEYAEKFKQVKKHIRQGNCYQVNLAQCFSAKISGSPLAAYQHIRLINPAPFSAFLQTPDFAILSHSPERFLLCKEDRRVSTKPIKGTRPRHSDPNIDVEYAKQLQNSLKDRAENVMIVDLMRNDLSKTCLPESVKVPELFKIESYANVHHLVSEVTATLSPHVSAIQLLQNCFPGGSITGAPKISVMAIIEELETISRGLYCGSIAYISHSGTMDSNIAIRSLQWANDTIYCHAGGGLVYDSELDSEYQETFDKVTILLEALAMNLET